LRTASGNEDDDGEKRRFADFRGFYKPFGGFFFILNNFFWSLESNERRSFSMVLLLALVFWAVLKIIIFCLFGANIGFVLLTF